MSQFHRSQKRLKERKRLEKQERKAQRKADRKIELEDGEQAGTASQDADGPDMLDEDGEVIPAPLEEEEG